MIFTAIVSFIFLRLFSQSLLPSVVFSLLLSITYGLYQNRYGKGLLEYPGPFLASLTNFWRVRDAYQNGNKRPSYVELHKTYGDVVRLGPDSLSFASPAAIEDIYSPKNNMAKV